MADEKPDVTAEDTGLRVVTVEESGQLAVDKPVGVKPEGVATLSIHYREGNPVIVATGGTAIPNTIEVQDAEGNAVAVYTAPSMTRTSQNEYYYMDTPK
ncbi:MAG TPA: hypothetical protein VM677_34090 [Actinokineospora sp.]|nr:hypothetical protein [Actinokineospora sp.]